MFLAEPDISFVQRISRYPSLKNRIELLMNILEDCAGDCQKANEAEMRVIEELRQLGTSLLGRAQARTVFSGFRRGTQHGG
jgi:hypothetical protein